MDAEPTSLSLRSGWLAVRLPGCSQSKPADSPLVSSGMFANQRRPRSWLP